MKNLLESITGSILQQKISALRIELIDQKTTALKVGSPKNKDLPHPEANRVIISRNAQNDDLILDYFQDDNRLAQDRPSPDYDALLEPYFKSTHLL